MAQTDSLEKDFEHELKDLLDCEKQLTQALSKMAKTASNDELRAAFEEHLEQTQRQIERLENIFEELDIAARPVKCEGIRGIIHEGETMISKAKKGPALDALLIGTAHGSETRHEGV